MDIVTLAEWIAPAATMLAAMMTAANLGARVTGWGFVVFTAGSLAWVLIGASSGQTGLLVTNGFLLLVNLLGIWRWLGRQRAYEDGARSAQARSGAAAGEILMSGAGTPSLALLDEAGQKIGHAVDVMIDCGDNRVAYVVVALPAEGEDAGGIGGSVGGTLAKAGIAEKLIALSPDDVRFAGDKLVLRRPVSWARAAPPLRDGDWPTADEALLWRGQGQ